MNFAESVERSARRSGADYFGVADLTPVANYVREQGGQFVASYPTAVSVGIVLPAGLVEPLLLTERDNGALITYERYVYDVVNLQLDTIAFDLSKEIERAGYQAIPVAASLRVPGRHFAGTFPHKLAAHLAGLGWIGKSCLLVTPGDGPRVRWCTILTDAPLPTGKPLQRNCGKCNQCVEACPAGAIKGRSFDPEEPRSKRLDVEKCEEYRKSIKESTGVRSCGRCVAACPFGS